MQKNRGILLINLGTPSAPTPAAVRKYLQEFLSDPYVVDLPAPIRFILLHLFILPFRSAKSAHAYQKIWTLAGSPLLLYTQALVTAVQAEIGTFAVVEMGMRYGEPSICAALKNLHEKNCDEIVVLPLFPQYALATTESVKAYVARAFASGQYGRPHLYWITEFYNNISFIAAIADIARHALASKNQRYFILMSFHGLPERHLDKVENKTEMSKAGTICNRHEPCPAITVHNTHCYRAQCYATARAIAAELKLTEKEYGVGFQSRLGRVPWIQPYTDDLIKLYREQGIKNLAVMCPAFTSDCLETLEEIGIRLRQQWQDLGGESFVLLPCVNDHSIWVKGIVAMAKDRVTK